MRLETARRFALSLPEATEEPHFEKSSFRVRGAGWRRKASKRVVAAHDAR